MTVIKLITKEYAYYLLKLITREYVIKITTKEYKQKNCVHVILDDKVWVRPYCEKWTKKMP